MTSPRYPREAIQAGLKSLKGQYALEICQIPASRLAERNIRKAGRHCRLSGGYPARYLGPGAGVRRIAGSRAAERELFAILSLDLGRNGANRRRHDGRHRADLQRSAEPGRYARDSGRPRHLGATAGWHPDELDFAGAAEGATRRVSVPRSVRAGLDGRAGWQARRDALALLPETG